MSIVIFQHTERTGPGRLAEVLRDHGHHLDIRRIWLGDDYPPDLDGVDGVISMGGHMGLADAAEHPWMATEMDFLRRAHDRKLPIVGVCLGCQILATALGGEVERMDKERREIGWLPLKAQFGGTVDPLHVGLPWTMMQFHWHGDHVTKPPPDAVILSSSDLTPIQAFQVGVRTYGFQYHFEVTRAQIELWSNVSPDQRVKEGLSHEKLMAETDQRFAEFDRISRRLCRSISEFLIPAAPLRVT